MTFTFIRTKGNQQLFLRLQDERQPFTPEEEDAILRVLRVKRVWYAIIFLFQIAFFLTCV